MREIANQRTADPSLRGGSRGAASCAEALDLFVREPMIATSSRLPGYRARQPSDDAPAAPTPAGQSETRLNVLDA